jgi:hypothetical protein
MLWGEGTMRKWWTAAAMTAMWLGQTAVGSAQGPGEVSGSGAMPEPLPISGGPGAQNPLVAPPGYGEGPVFPGPTQAGAPEEGGHRGIYFSSGSLGLRRQRLGNAVSPFSGLGAGQPLAVIDAGSGAIDTGNGPILGQTMTILETRDIAPNYIWGPVATIGFQYGNDALEFTGYWLPDQESKTNNINAGLIDVPFFNPPIGFEGDNGLWRQADQVVTSFRSQIGNAEINLRHWSESCPGFQWIWGLRYFDLNESLGIFTDDDGILIRDLNGNPDPLRQATYFTRAHSHIIAPQVGFEYDLPILRWFTMGGTAKSAAGINFYDVTRSLKRGDGLIGFDETRDASTFSAIFEFGAFGDIAIYQWLHFRAGYTAMFVLHVPTASNEIDFNLNNTTPALNSSGSIFYHGPSFQVSLSF